MKIEVKPSQVTLRIGDTEIRGFMDGTFLEYEPQRKPVPVSGTYHCTVTLTHDHSWRPIEGERARYECGCGAQGLKDLRTGQIGLVAEKHHVRPEQLDAQPSARVSLGDGNGWCTVTPSDTRAR